MGVFQLDRAGIFKARTLSWCVSPSQNSQSVAVKIDFKITAQLDEENQWVSWEGAEDEYTTTGWFWIVKKDGTLNTTTIENLVKSVGWSGVLEDVHGVPPIGVCQINVKEEEYKGNKQYKPSWINPEDYKPTGEASAEDVAGLSRRFGSMLKAAAAGAKKSMAAPPAKQESRSAPPAKPVGSAMTADEQKKFDDSIPF